jgi:hypothetical protein
MVLKLYEKNHVLKAMVIREYGSRKLWSRASTINVFCIGVEKWTMKPVETILRGDWRVEGEWWRGWI